MLILGEKVTPGESTYYWWISIFHGSYGLPPIRSFPPYGVSSSRNAALLLLFSILDCVNILRTGMESP